MNLKEAKELLKKNGYKLSINEDKYMDALDDEEDLIFRNGQIKQIYERLFKILENHYGNKVENIRKDYYKLHINDKIDLVIESDGPSQLELYVVRVLKRKGTVYKSDIIISPQWGFHAEDIDNKEHIDEMLGDFDKAIKKEQNPSFLKRVFDPERYNESTEVNEDYNHYRNRFYQMNLKRKKAAEEKKATGLASDGYQDDLNEVVSVISKKHEVIGTKEVPAEEGYKDYKIVTKDNKVYTLEFKNRMFDYRGHLYPWRLTLSTSKFGFVVIGYSLNQLKNYFNKVK